jgi:hypothetical protein
MEATIAKAMSVIRRGATISAAAFAVAISASEADAFDQEEALANPAVQAYWACLSRGVDHFARISAEAPSVIVRAALGRCGRQRDEAVIELRQMGAARLPYDIMEAIETGFEDTATAAILEMRAGNKGGTGLATKPDESVTPGERPATAQENASLPEPPAGCYWAKGDDGWMLDCTHMIPKD